MKAFRSDPFFKGPIDGKAIEKQHQDIVKKCSPLLQEKLQKQSDYGFHRNVEKEKEVDKETEKELDKETEKEMTNELELGNLFKREDKQIWQKEGLFTKSYFSDRIRGASDQLETENRQRITPVSVFAKAGLTKKQFAPNFSKGLLSSLMICPIHLYPEPKAAPFVISQQYPRKVLVLQDKKTNAIEVLLVNIDDLHQFEEFLREDLQNPQPGPRELNIGIYDLEIGMTLMGSEPVDEIALEKDPGFLQLKVEAKFFAAMMNFNTAEEALLKKWIQKNGPKKMATYFQGVILRNRKESFKAFPYSDLYRIFEELGVFE